MSLFVDCGGSNPVKKRRRTSGASRSQQRAGRGGLPPGSDTQRVRLDRSLVFILLVDARGVFPLAIYDVYFKKQVGSVRASTTDDRPVGWRGVALGLMREANIPFLKIISLRGRGKVRHRARRRAPLRRPRPSSRTACHLGEQAPLLFNFFSKDPSSLRTARMFTTK